MDLVQIGKFIAELRKEQELTQEQLGEKIGVTNKTISRWENGYYLPPADVLLAMSQLFDVSVNEILSGKRLLAEEYKEAAETKSDLRDLRYRQCTGHDRRYTFYTTSPNRCPMPSMPQALSRCGSHPQ